MNGEGSVRVKGKQLDRVMKTRREKGFLILAVFTTGSYDESVVKTVFIARS
jgi:acetolactate synthase regulatory subunit